MTLSELIYWFGPPLLWIMIFKTFPDFVAGALLKSFERRQTARIETLKGEIQRANNAEVETLKARLQAVSTALKASTDAALAGSAELRTKQIEATERLWRQILQLRDDFSDILFIYAGLTPAEIRDAITHQTEPAYHLVGPVVQRYANIEFLQKKIEGSSLRFADTRIYVGDKLWLLFYSYQIVIMRPAVMLGTISKREKYFDWQQDDVIRATMLKTVGEETWLKASQSEVGGIDLLLRNIEALFLKEAARIMSGSQDFADAISNFQATMVYHEAEQSKKAP